MVHYSSGHSSVWSMCCSLHIPSMASALSLMLMLSVHAFLTDSLRHWVASQMFAAQAKCIFLLDWFKSWKFTIRTMLAVMPLITALCFSFCCRAISRLFVLCWFWTESLITWLLGGENKHSVSQIGCFQGCRGSGVCMQQRFGYFLFFWRKHCGPVVWNGFLCGFPVILVREPVSAPAGSQSAMWIFHRAVTACALRALFTRDCVFWIQTHTCE